MTITGHVEGIVHAETQIHEDEATRGERRRTAGLTEVGSSKTPSSCPTTASGGTRATIAEIETVITPSGGPPPLG